MKLGDVMLAVICGLVITVSVFHISSNNSNSFTQNQTVEVK